MTAHHGRNSPEDMYAVDVANTIRTSARSGNLEDTFALQLAHCVTARRGRDGASGNETFALGFNTTQDPISMDDTSPSIGIESMGVFAFDPRQVTQPGNRATVELGRPSPTISSSGTVAVAGGLRPRRLTPREVERCFGFEPHVVSLRMTICRSSETARFVEWSSDGSHRSERGPADGSVELDCEADRILLDIPGLDSAFDAGTAKQSSRSTRQGQRGNFALAVALMLSESETRTTTGAAASPPSMLFSFLPSSGSQRAVVSGRGIEESVDAAVQRAVAATTSITLPPGHASQRFGLKLETLCSFVGDAIASSIRGPMSMANSFDVEFTSTRGYTNIPIGKRGKPAKDASRYKALGNSMAVPVLAWLGRRMQTVEGIIRGQR